MTLYGNQDFRPGGAFQDAVVETVPASDPDRHYYASSRRWVLVRTLTGLEAAKYPAWDDNVVGVIVYEIAASCPWVIDWRFTGARVLYVDACDINPFPEGEITGDTRFQLHDLADAHNQRRAEQYRASRRSLPERCNSPDHELPLRDPG